MAALAAAQKAAQVAASGVPADSRANAALWSQSMVEFLALSILAFTFAALCLGSALLWKSSAGGAQVLRVFGVLTIIGLSALLLVVGYSNEQLTPIVGLFGAIAGYLLGKDIKTSPSPSRTERDGDQD